MDKVEVPVMLVVGENDLLADLEDNQVLAKELNKLI